MLASGLVSWPPAAAAAATSDCDLEAGRQAGGRAKGLACIVILLQSKCTASHIHSPAAYARPELQAHTKGLPTNKELPPAELLDLPTHAWLLNISCAVCLAGQAAAAAAVAWRPIAKHIAEPGEPPPPVGRENWAPQGLRQVEASRRTSATWCVRCPAQWQQGQQQQRSSRRTSGASGSASSPPCVPVPGSPSCPLPPAAAAGRPPVPCAARAAAAAAGLPSPPAPGIAAAAAAPPTDGEGSKCAGSVWVQNQQNS